MKNNIMGSGNSIWEDARRIIETSGPTGKIRQVNIGLGQLKLQQEIRIVHAGEVNYKWEDVPTIFESEELNEKETSK